MTLKEEVLGILQDVIFESRQSDPGVGIFAREDLAQAFERLAEYVKLDLDRVFVPSPEPGEPLDNYFRRLTPEQLRTWELTSTRVRLYAEKIGAGEGETILQATERVLAERDALRAQAGAR